MDAGSSTTGDGKRWDHRAHSGSQGSRGSRSRPVATGSAFTRLRRDIADVYERYGKRTSIAHKRFVWMLVLIGAALRGWLLFTPITAEEATAYMTFATTPFAETISNYALPINHVFHTVLSKWSTAIFGTHVWAMRLPAFLAGVLVLPLFYLFVRSMFNRYIAMMALALAAASPCLIELSALANGYSITWLCLMLALLFGRHLVRDNNFVSAIIMGVSCAFAMWAVPSIIHGVLMVYLWALFSMLTKYERSIGSRSSVLALSFAVFIVLTMVLYMPVMLAHGADQLFQHNTEAQHDWKTFSLAYPDRVLDFWVWVVDPTWWWMAAIGFLCLTHAAYISAKFRTLIIALILGSVPLSLVLADAGTPWQWSFTLFIFHLGMAIALFYLLKFVQDKMIPGFGKRSRTAGASVVLVLLFALPGMSVVHDRVPHLPEAEACAELLAKAMNTGDKLCMDITWEASVDLHLRELGRDPKALRGDTPPGRLLFVVTEAANGSPVEGLFARCDQRMEQYEELSLVKDWGRMEIFAARSR